MACMSGAQPAISEEAFLHFREEIGFMGGAGYFLFLFFLACPYLDLCEPEAPPRAPGAGLI